MNEVETNNIPFEKKSENFSNPQTETNKFHKLKMKKQKNI
jgi:flagellar biosynthesis chaperone FliJ